MTTDDDLKPLDDHDKFALPPESVEAMRRWRLACRAMFTGIPEVKSMQSLEGNVNE